MNVGIHSLSRVGGKTIRTRHEGETTMLLIEKRPIVDRVSSGLGRVDVMSGGMVRFVLYIEEPISGAPVQYVISEKIVLPIDAVPDGILLASQACALQLVGSVKRLVLPAYMH